MARKNINTLHIYIPPEANANYRNRIQSPQPYIQPEYKSSFIKNWLWGAAIILLAMLFYNRKDRREIYALLTSMGIIAAIRSGRPIPESIRRRYFI